MWNQGGHIVTNSHVVKAIPPQSIGVILYDPPRIANPQRFRAQVVGSDERKDIAVLKIDANQELLVPVLRAKIEELKVGQKAIAIGNPFGLDHTRSPPASSARWAVRRWALAA